MSVPRNFYDDVGGAPVFHKLVARFYEGVRADPVLRPLYPQEDLGRPRSGCGCSWSSTGAARAPTPTQRGHPRLRMRHAPFAIGPAERDAWLRLMRDRRRRGLELPPSTATRSGSYLEYAAASMVNSARSDRRSTVPSRMPAVHRGGGTPSSTRSTSAASPTATATASATWPASAAGSATWSCSASTPCGSRRSTPRRWPTTATTSPTPADVDPRVRRPRRVRRAGRRRARPRHPGDRRPGAQPHLGPTTRGSARRWPPPPGQPGAGALPLPRRAGAPTGAGRRTTGLASSAARPGPGSPRTRAAASGTCTCSPPSSPT